MSILVLSLERVPVDEGAALPTAACAGGAGEHSLPAGEGAALMQMRTGCDIDVTLWKYSESTVKASEEQLHRKMNF